MKPWLETWSADDARVELVTPGKYSGDPPEYRGVAHVFENDPDPLYFASERAKLVAAAPAMARLLLKHEYTTQEHEKGSVTTCSCCGSSEIQRAPEHTGPDGQKRWWTWAPHAPGCELDAQLTALGFDTPEKREEARAEIAKMPRGT